MSTPKTPDPNSPWDESRCDELDLLSELLSLCRGIDKGSSVLAKLQKIIVLSDRLSRTEYGKHISFLSFLEKQAIPEPVS